VDYNSKESISTHAETIATAANSNQWLLEFLSSA